MTETNPRAVLRARQSAGLSPEQLAEETGVPVEDIQALEAGEDAPAASADALRLWYAQRHGFDVRVGPSS